MRRIKKHFKKVVMPIVLMIVFAVSAIASFTVAYFSDTHNADVTIKLLEVTNSTSSSEDLLPSDLVANNFFSKTITSEITSSKAIYLRTYVVVSMQTLENNNIVERTDLISLINVNKSTKGADDKFYYTNNDGSTTLQTLQDTTITLTYTFYVSKDVSSDLFLNNDDTLNTSLKTTITYKFEYCESSALAEWDEKGSVGSLSGVIYGQTTQASTPSPESPVPFNYNSTKVTAENMASLDATSSEIGKWAVNKGDDTYLFLDEPLRSVGTYKDELDLSTGIVKRFIQCVKPLVSDGWSFNEADNSSAGATFGVIISKNSILGIYNEDSSLNQVLFLNTTFMSSHFTNSGSSVYSGSNSGYSYGMDLNPHYIAVRKTGISSVSDFSDWFYDQIDAGTPVEFLLVKTTPSYEKIEI